MKQPKHIQKLFNRIKGGHIPDVEAAEQELQEIVTALLDYARVERDTAEYYAGNLLCSTFERRWGFSPTAHGNHLHMRNEALYEAGE